ncbi:MAG TPA: hypothetical protein PKD55_16850 [Bellilinea sp.]|nr:hypothetical protein [Bellilinea sp.]
MRRGLGQYVKKGLGGARTATRRMGGTSRTAGTLYRALSDIAGGRTIEESPVEFALLRGRSASEVIDAVVEVVQPIDGTLDAESRRKSVRDALSEVLSRFPEADLFNLSEEQRIHVIQTYVALDVYGRFHLDVGKAVQNKAPSLRIALSRLKEVKDYIKQEVSAAFRRLHRDGENPSADRIAGMVRQALQNTFQVFEDYIS